jgi:hypothetical protein
MRIIVAGSRKLMTGAAAFTAAVILALGDEDLVLLRSPKDGAPGYFEQDIAQMCELNKVPYKYFMPQPTEETPGRASVFVRDMDMVADADEALLFFTPEDAAYGYSGTMHLLEKSLEADIRVSAYTVNHRNVVERVGDNAGRVS